MSFPKPAKTVREQIAILKSRNMLFADEAAAEDLLQNVSYYHLGLYWFDLRLKANPQLKNDNKRLEQFAEGTHFGEVIRRYQFDAKLRLLILQALGQFEVSLKTKWASHFSHKYGPLFYMDKSHYQSGDKKSQTETITKLEENFANSKDDFIIKCREKNASNMLPEAWVIAELFDFGTLLYLILFLQQADKQELAHLYAEDREEDFLKGGEFIKFLSQLRLIRNICAHHGRLWNRSFNLILPQAKAPLLAEALNAVRVKKLYNSLCYIAYVLRRVDAKAEWKNQLKALLADYPEYTNTMGFPQDWDKARLWQ